MSSWVMERHTIYFDHKTTYDIDLYWDKFGIFCVSVYLEGENRPIYESKYNDIETATRKFKRQIRKLQKELKEKYDSERHNQQ